MKLLAIAASLFLATSTAHADELEDAAAVILNLNGLLCAEVLDLNQLKQKGIFEVRCTKYRGGEAEATYIIDANSGNAWEE